MTNRLPKLQVALDHSTMSDAVKAASLVGNGEVIYH